MSQISMLDGQQSMTKAVFLALLQYRAIKAAPNASIDGDSPLPSAQTIQSIDQALLGGREYPNWHALLNDSTCVDMLVKEVLASKSDDHLSSLIVGLEYHTQSIVSQEYSSPVCTAYCFSKQMAGSASTAECLALITWLVIQAYELTCSERVSVNEIIETFYDEETALTNAPRERLTQPSGPQDGEIGVVLHVQTRKGAAAAFWDDTGRTIQILRSAGLNETFAYGFDFHWRAEESIKEYNGCITSTWSKPQRALHDTVSARVLQVLPLPWIVVGGRCPAERYRRTLSPEAKSILVPVANVEEVKLPFAIDIRKQQIRRVAILLPHPSVCCFSVNGSRKAEGQILDAGVEFILWLHARPYRERTFVETAAGIRWQPRGQAPLAAVRRLWRRQCEEGSDVDRSKINPVVLCWMQKYVAANSSVDHISSSLLHDAVSILNLKLSDAKLRFYGRKRSQYWNGRPVTISQNCYVSIPTSVGLLEVYVGVQAQCALHREGGDISPKIFFLKDEILLCAQHKVIWRANVAEITPTEARGQWKAQIERELLQGPPEAIVTLDQILTAAHSSTALEHRIASDQSFVDETIEKMIATEKTRVPLNLNDNDSSTASASEEVEAPPILRTANTVALRYRRRERVEKSIWNSHEVLITQDGECCIMIPGPKTLTLFGGVKLFRDAEPQKDNAVTIHICGDKVLLRQPGKLLYQRSVKDMIVKRENPEEWKKQIVREAMFGDPKTIQEARQWVQSCDTPRPQTRAEKVSRAKHASGVMKASRVKKASRKSNRICI